MSVLRIYNVSDYIHAGAAPRTKGKTPSYYSGVREMPDGAYAESRLPTGGIAFMLNPIFERLTSKEYKDETLVFCIDDTPNYKRELYFDVLRDEMGYKGKRPEKLLDVSIQRKAIKDILSLVSPNVLFVEDMEADDIIGSLVWMYKKHYDKVIVHTRDTDLYCLIDDNVIIDRVGNQGKYVTKSNFSENASTKNGFKLPFNGMIIEKLLSGDQSDNIPPVNPDMAEKIKSSITPDKYPYLVNVNLARSWVGQAVDYDKRTMGLFDLLVPTKVDEDYLTIYDESINFNRLYYIGLKVQNKYCRKNTYEEDIPEVKEVLDYYTNEYHMRGGRCRV